MLTTALHLCRAGYRSQHEQLQYDRDCTWNDNGKVVASTSPLELYSDTDRLTSAICIRAGWQVATCPTRATPDGTSTWPDVALWP